MTDETTPAQIARLDEKLSGVHEYVRAIAADVREMAATAHRVTALETTVAAHAEHLNALRNLRNDTRGEAVRFVAAVLVALLAGYLGGHSTPADPRPHVEAK